MIIHLPEIVFNVQGHDQELIVTCQLIATSGSQVKYRLWLGYGDSLYCSVETSAFDVDAVNRILKQGESEWYFQVSDDPSEPFPKTEYAKQLGILLMKVSKLNGFINS